MRTRHIFAGLLIGAVVMFTGGCSDDSTSSSGTYIDVSFQDMAPSGAAIIAQGQPALSSVNITSARVVIGKILFESDSGDSARFHSEEHEPLIVELDLSGRNHRLGVLAVSPGTYTRSLFRIERLEESAPDAFAAYPEMRGISIRIEGYVNGFADSTFLFTTTLDEEQQLAFDPLVIAEDGREQIIFQFDHRNWFRDEGGVIIDPREAQIASSRSIVETNLVNAFDIAHP